LLKHSILTHGVKQPIVINTYPGREGIIINGVEVYKISKAFGIYEIPCYDLYVPIEVEKEFHYLFSIKCREYSIADIITELKNRQYLDYFTQGNVSNAMNTDAFNKGEAVLKDKNNLIQPRKNSFLLRFDDSFNGYLLRLQEMLGTKSQNEALLKLILDAVEGRIVLC
jgi:hypothetical protein